MSEIIIRDIISQALSIGGVVLNPVIFICEYTGNFTQTTNSNFYYQGVKLTDIALMELIQNKVGSQLVNVNFIGDRRVVPTQMPSSRTVTIGDWSFIYTSEERNLGLDHWYITEASVVNTSTGFILAAGTSANGTHGGYAPIIMLKDVNTSKYFYCRSVNYVTTRVTDTYDEGVNVSGVFPKAPVNIGSLNQATTQYSFACPAGLYDYTPSPADDPYDDQGGSTTPGGGGGIGVDNIINDDIDFPTPVAASASNANFISIWTPTLDQVQNLASWMWTTDPLKWGFWQKLLQNPLDLIFSLSIMPIPIHHTDDPSTPSLDDLIASKDSLALGWQDTGIMMDWVTEQYVTLDMGSIDLEEVWGAFLDYEPYTKIDIFLPYIGTKQLDTNDCMPRTIALRYIIDLATGTCVALVKCDNSVYYHFSGNCASQIPITVNQCQEIVRGLMTMAVGAATFTVGSELAAAATTAKAASKASHVMMGGAATAAGGASNAAKGVTVSRSGVIGCAAGLMDIQTPYLIISRPRQAVPEEQSKYTGYPSFMTKQIGDLFGYTEIQIIHMEHMTCTDEEYDEIETLLSEGVII